MGNHLCGWWIGEADVLIPCLAVEVWPKASSLLTNSGFNSLNWLDHSLVRLDVLRSTSSIVVAVSLITVCFPLPTTIIMMIRNKTSQSDATVRGYELLYLSLPLSLNHQLKWSSRQGTHSNILVSHMFPWIQSALVHLPGCTRADHEWLTSWIIHAGISSYSGTTTKA